MAGGGGPFQASDVRYVTATVAQSLGNQPVQTPDGANLPAAGQTKYRVLALAVMVGATATTVQFVNSITGTALTPAFPCGANGGIVLPYNSYGWFETKLGESIGVTTGAGATAVVQAVVAKNLVGT